MKLFHSPNLVNIYKEHSGTSKNSAGILFDWLSTVSDNWSKCCRNERKTSQFCDISVKNVWDGLPLSWKDLPHLKQNNDYLKWDLPPFLDTSPRQLFGTLGAHRLWQLNLQSVTVREKQREWERVCKMGGRKIEKGDRERERKMAYPYETCLIALWLQTDPYLSARVPNELSHTRYYHTLFCWIYKVQLY